MTPLHLSCLYGGYEGVMALLHEAQQIIDVDAENGQRQIPEALAKERRVQRAVKKYRGTLDERRQADLMEQCLRRVFHLFDVDRNGYILPDAWADTMSLVAQHFDQHCGSHMDEVFDLADKN